MYHPLVESMYEAIEHINWIFTRNDENNIDFFKVKILTHFS